jgi:hypothetical protein
MCFAFCLLFVSCSWLAVSVRQRVYLLNLTSHKLVHSLPPLADPQPPITAISFTADSTTLVVVGSTHQLAAYSAATGQPTDWSAKHSGSLPPKLLKMPGNINSIASCPLAPSSLFLASSEAACHIDMAAPLTVDDADGGSGGKRKRRRSKPSAASEPVGTNCRMLYCAEPVLHAAYVAPDALLVVSAWACLPSCPVGTARPAPVGTACLCVCLWVLSAGWFYPNLNLVAALLLLLLLPNMCVLSACLPSSTHPDSLRLVFLPCPALQVERGWSQVFEKVAAPMYRHRYGT